MLEIRRVSELNLKKIIAGLVFFMLIIGSLLAQKDPTEKCKFIGVSKAKNEHRSYLAKTYKKPKKKLKYKYRVIRHRFYYTEAPKKYEIFNPNINP